MKLIVTVLCFVFYLSSGFAQTYNFICEDEGYETLSGGGTFENVDGSGIDLIISGMVDDACAYCGYLQTGINNGESDGAIHNYTFTFSQPVDFNFFIDNITIDTTVYCDYDFLNFSGDPIFTDASNINI